MAAVDAESMVGGTCFHPDVIPSECSRVLVLNLTGSIHRAFGTQQVSCTLTTPSFLSRGTLFVGPSAKIRSTELRFKGGAPGAGMGKTVRAKLPPTS